MDIDLSILIPIILFVIAPHIFNKFGIESIYPKIVYMVIVVIIAIFLNMYKISFSTSTMNDRVATQLIQSITLEKTPIKSENISNIIHGKRYSDNKGLYNIQAEIIKNDTKYYIYIKSHCSFFKGCSVSKSELAIVEKRYVDSTRGLNYAIPNSDVHGEDLLILDEEELFNKKSCANITSLASLKSKFIKKENSKIDVNTKISDNTFLNKTPGDGYSYTKGCKTTMKVKFKIKEEFKGNIKEIKHIFSYIKEEDNNAYEGNIFAVYDIYVNYDKKTAMEHKFLKF